MSGGYYVQCFDRVATDPSSAKLVSFSYGHTTSSVFYSGSGFVGQYQQQKTKMYKLFAKRLLGDEEKKFIIDNREINEAIFVCLNRNQFKDNLYRKTSTITYWFSSSPGSGQPTIFAFADTDIQNFEMSDKRSSVFQEFCGPYTKLFHGSLFENKGLNFLNAGVMVVEPTFVDTGSLNGNTWSGSYGFEELAKGVSGTTYNDILFAIRNKVAALTFTSSQNVKSLYSICSANSDEFNYSANPSFTKNNGEIITTVSSSNNSPTTYITSIGLLGPNNEVLAVAKCSKPIKKDPDLNVKIVVRLDY